MSKDLNVVYLIGRLTKAVELKYSQAGKPFCTIGIAVNDDWKETKVCHFIDVVFFGSTAEVLAKYTTKGSLLQVTGKLKVEKWTDQQGQNKQKLCVQGESVQFLSKGSQESSNVNKVKQEFEGSIVEDPWAE